MKICRLIPLSVGSISIVDSTFEGQHHENFVHFVEASMKIKVE
jgi:hypothetical protein